jgi:nucleotidyltransferase substrate binding protein (TIGR01987 family)
MDKAVLSEMEEQGLIKSFEYTYELAWNVMKDFLLDRGVQNIFGSRDAISEAFRLGLITEGEDWMEMYKDRNKTAHTYNEDTAKEILAAIKNDYFLLFTAFSVKMNSLLSGEKNDIRP